jgi:hypothetical protein
VNSATLAETATAIQQARVEPAAKSIPELALKTGRSRMTIAQIDRVIAPTRKATRWRRSAREKPRP